jgi:hypothetical protein
MYYIYKMSQNDYIQLKRTTTVLKSNQTNQSQKTKRLPPVLYPNDYTDFKSYNLETTVSNTKNTYSRLILASNKTIFNMEKNVSNCTTFPLCINTNQRVNRVLNTGQLYPDPVNKLLPGFKPNINKTFTPTTCTFTLQNGKVTRTVACDKTICKCRTRIYPFNKFINKKFNYFDSKYIF